MLKLQHQLLEEISVPPFCELSIRLKKQLSIAVVIAFCALSLTACSSIVDVPSANYNSRVNFIVIHATAENYAESMRLLTQPTDNPVSSHYLIPTSGDQTYPMADLKIHRLVPDYLRAWHAGVSYWAGKSGLNDQSIGIEIVNEFDCVGTTEPIEETDPKSVSCDFIPYPPEQIDLVIELVSGLLERYPDVDPLDIVAHSDIAILRKSDPGATFPWKRLYDAGIGAWYDDDTLHDYRTRFSDRLPSIETIQQALIALGYKLEVTGEFDRSTQYVLRAFQLHFRPHDHSGEIDVESIAILYALLAKYRVEELHELELSELEIAE